MGVALVVVGTGPRVGRSGVIELGGRVAMARLFSGLLGISPLVVFGGSCHLPLFHPASGALRCFHAPSRVAGGVPGFLFYFILFISWGVFCVRVLCVCGCCVCAGVACVRVVSVGGVLWVFYPSFPLFLLWHAA